MKKGWLCRTSYDEIVHTWWWPVEIQIELWSRSSYDDSERSRSRDDPDPVVMIQIEWWSRSSLERWSRSSDDPDPVQWWWSRSSDDLDSVMMIQIEWWSRSCDDVLWWSRSRDDPDPDDLKMKMTWRRRRLDDRDDLKTNMIQWYIEEDQCWKLCRKNTFLVKRECWCICNLGMYSYMYFIYCNPMFIPGFFYYVFESYCLTPMFRSGGLLM